MAEPLAMSADEAPIFIAYAVAGDVHVNDLDGEPAVERQPSAAREVWIGYAAIPATPPAQTAYPGTLSGNVRGIAGVSLTLKAGTTTRYESAADEFLDMVPPSVETSAGGVYQPVVRDSSGAIVPYNPAVWIADGFLKVVEFRYGLPAGVSAPLTIDYWRYVGEFAIGEAAGGVEIFENVAGVTRSDAVAPGYALTNDFVFGSPQLDDAGNAGEDARIFFDKSKSAFRAGAAEAAQWDDANRGTNSVAMGHNTTASGTNSTVGGGSNNAASAGQATVGGGGVNTASASHATVGGGSTNAASGTNSTISGGALGIASNVYSAVGGGQSNTASGSHSVVGGGALGVASNVYSVVGGGQSNAASGSHSAVGGGFSNTALDEYSVVGGGQANTAPGPRGVVSGGGNNDSGSEFSGTVGGGSNNVISFGAGGSGANNTVGGGNANLITVGAGSACPNNTIAGGTGNQTTGLGTGGSNTIGGGKDNVLSIGTGATAEFNVIAGGNANLITAPAAAASCSHNVIAGGDDNTITAAAGLNVIVGGDTNRISGTGNSLGNTILGGTTNAITGAAAAYNVVGGRRHTLTGSADCTVFGDTATVGAFSNCFVFSDSNGAATATASDQVTFVCAGGARFFSNAAATTGPTFAAGGADWVSSCSRDVKDLHGLVDTDDALERFGQLPLYDYNYIAHRGTGVTYRGPVSEEFHALFPSGKSDKTIGTMDLDGAALAAIQGLLGRQNGLAARVDEQAKLILELQARLV